MRRGLAALGLAAAASGCSGPTTPTDVLAPGETVVLSAGGVLVFGDRGALDPWRERIEAAVGEAVARTATRIPLGDVRIEVTAGPQWVIPELGFGGRADVGRVRLGFAPSALLDATLETQLVPLVAHELHHVARLGRRGYPQSLLEAMVLEGLADRFALEVVDTEPPPWATALPPAEIDPWLDRARSVWLSTSYDHSAWFFGTSPQIPRWAGYSLGFELVGRYLEAHSGSLASTLVAEPAHSFATPSR